MRRFIIRVVFVVMVPCASAGAAEKHIAREQLPAPVAATMDAQTKGAAIQGYVTEVENGKRVYEVETTVQGHSRDLQVALDGTLNEVEEEVAFDQLPAPVQKSLLQRAGGAKIVKVESITKQQKLVAYEASTRKGTQKGEVQVGPAGNRLKYEQ